MASQTGKSVHIATPPGINEAVWWLCYVHNFDNHDVNYDFVNNRGPNPTDITLVLQKMLAMYIYNLL